MSINEKKTFEDFDEEINKLFTLLKFKNFPITLIGSASLKSQEYFADYDFSSLIPISKTSPQKAYSEFNKILNRIDNLDYIYFVELKLQQKNGEKTKWFPDSSFDKDSFIDNFKDVDFVKLDLIVKINDIFTDVNCTYKFVDRLPDNSKVHTPSLKQLHDFKDEIEEFEKEGKYFKALKRKFSIYRLLNNKKNSQKLSDVFNGNLGKMYRLSSQLETIQILMDHYKSPDIDKLIDINLKKIGEFKNKNNLKDRITELQNFVNKSAKKLNKKFIIKV